MMDLEPIWQSFIMLLTQRTFIETASWKKMAGIPFLYVTLTGDIPQPELEKELMHCAAIAMRGKRLHSETIFVRKEAQTYVYRHRFLVPQEKMFCCGNLCIDCTRFKDK